MLLIFIGPPTHNLSGSNIFLELDGTSIEINISATISIAKDINNNYLLECADTALHYAKNTNQPYVIYTKELEAKMDLSPIEKRKMRDQFYRDIGKIADMTIAGVKNYGLDGKKKK